MEHLRDAARDGKDSHFEVCELETTSLMSRRFALVGRMMFRALADSLADIQLFTRTWNGGPLLKQRQINGFRLIVRADLDVGHQIYCHGQYEPEESRYLRQEMRAADICIDVGANVGYYTLLMATTASRGFVHAFEPSPLTASLLKTNLLLNDVRNADINQEALGDVPGEVEFIVSTDDAYSSLLDTGRKPVLGRNRVTMTTLDSYCETRHIERVDCLKVDVEGAEERVIRGAAGLLANQRRKPRLVMLELYNPMLSKYESSIDQVLALMRSFNYEPFRVKGGRVAAFSRRDYDTHYNVFFSPGEQTCEARTEIASLAAGRGENWALKP